MRLPARVAEANDRIIAFMDRLWLSQVCRRDPDRLHTSSDGQNREVGLELDFSTGVRYSQRKIQFLLISNFGAKKT